MAGLCTRVHTRCAGVHIDSSWGLIRPLVPLGESLKVIAGSSSSGMDAKARVLQAVNIVELIGQSVKLIRRGKDYVGLCPFHQEKTPSFKVDASKQYFYCFGCKANGNAIDFVMKRDRLEFKEALELLARQQNIDLPRFGGGKQNSSERQSLLDAHSAACGLFEKLLAHPQIGAAAREYLSKRGFTPETIKRFQIGLAHDSWDSLLKSQAMKKFPANLLQQAGLVKAREGSDGHYDTFRNRIMFPIRDEQGRIIAFGGRVMPGSNDPAKYLNSPETPLFSKSRCIYGLDFAKQRIVEQKSVAIVEGYTDVVMAHQFGATNVVSVLGTAMTQQHAGILRRFAERIVLLFDPDTAGDVAVNRAVELLLTEEVEIAIASIPDDADPDEFILTQGAGAFDALLSNAQDVLSYKWRQLMREFGASSGITGQQKSVEQYLELLAGARGSAMIDPLRWGPILARVSRLTGVPQDELNRRFKTSPKRAAPQKEAPRSALIAKPLTASDRAERWLLGALLVEPSLWARVQRDIEPQHFAGESPRRLAEILWTHQRDEGESEFNELLGQIDDTELKELAISLVQEIQAMSSLDQTLADAMSFMRNVRRDVAPEVSDEVEWLRQEAERARKRAAT